MHYKFISDSVVARIDDDGLSRMSCMTNDAAYLAWLAEGNTPDPADPTPEPSITDQINELERSQLMPRATREFMLLTMEAQFTPDQLAANPGYRAVKAFDERIKALRAQL